jgi:acyl-CoA synthetase (AMP-forming)/AMP-acid ligase II
MSSQFLYEKWLATANAFGPAPALFDEISGRVWTFRELFAEGERTAARNLDPISFPRGQGAEFIITLLQAWRAGSVACPLEVHQQEPILATLPAGAAHLKLTSASSGSAKCVVFTGAQLAADAENIVVTMGLRRDWPNLACISLAHSYGFSNLVLPLLLHGIPLILAPAPLPETLRAISKRFPAIALPAVPALWKIWHESDAILPQIQLAISAGAPLPLSLEIEVFDSVGVKIHNFYGSSECGGIAYDRSLTPRKSSPLAGSALANVRLSVSPSGTLIVESDAVGENYWPEADPALRPGRFETSDLAEIVDENVHLLGRASDVLNIAGRKASPENIEAHLRSHPAVVECVVFGIPSSTQERAETIVAALNTRSSISIPELTAFLSQKLPSWQIPRQWWFTHELAANNRGKVSRAGWKRRFVEARQSDGSIS